MHPLLDAAWDQNWKVSQTKKGHLRFLSPDGGSPVIGPLTPSDHRSPLNCRSTLRQRGLDV